MRSAVFKAVNYRDTHGHRPDLGITRPAPTPEEQHRVAIGNIKAALRQMDRALAGYPGDATDLHARLDVLQQELDDMARIPIFAPRQSGGRSGTNDRRAERTSRAIEESRKKAARYWDAIDEASRPASPDDAA